MNDESAAGAAVTPCEHAEAWAIGALDDADARAFAAHLGGCPRCPAVVREFEELGALLARGAPAARPSAGLKARVMARARADGRSGAANASRRPARRWLALAAAVAGLTVIGVLGSRLSQSSARQAVLADSLARRETRIAELLRQRDAILDGNTAMYVLRPTGDPAAHYGAQVFWRRDQQTWLVHAYELPSLPAGRVYQLWFVTPDAKISAGVFEVDPEGHGIAVIDVPPAARGANAAAFSVEPAGGSAQPTGPIVVAGSVL